MKRWITLTSFLATALLLLASAAARTPRTPTTFAVPPGSPLIAQSSCSDARTRILDWAAYMAIESRYYMYRRGGIPMPTADTDARQTAGAEKASGGAGQSGPGNYTGTNVQEVGVDEADMVKTDGKFVYTVNGHDVVIIASWPANRARVVARYKLPAQVTPQNLFLEDDRLVVLSHVFEQLATPATKPGAGTADEKRVARPYPDSSNYFTGTRVTVLDVSNRSRPRLIHEADIEGMMAQARMIGDDVYLVSNAAMQVPPVIVQAAYAKAGQLDFVADDANIDRSMAARLRAYRAVRAHLDARFGRVNLTVAMPRQRHTRSGGGMSSLRPLYACSDVLVPSGGSQLGTLNVVHFDIDQPERLDAVGLMASGWQIYASTDALYAAMPNYGWYHIWGWGPQSSGADYNVTNVHKFDLRGEGDSPRYVASGRVRGHILNQFSMSEHDGFLRVATTDQAWGGDGPTQTGNHLYVMAERGRRLTTVGAIEDLAPGERIYSARMMGDKGYMVTFRQTDPLFTLDLSNPRNPRVAGELKINGFSSYIHPLDGDHLLTIGQDAGDDGRVQGAHVQVFDVSDPARPRRTAHKRLVDRNGWSTSAAQWDHHAFTYDPRTHVLAVPMTSYSSEPGKSFLGLVMLQVEKDSFEELGRITHDRLADQLRTAECAQAVNNGNYLCTNPTHPDWRAQIHRSIIMDELIVSLSNLGLQVNNLNRPDRTVARVMLAPLPLTAANQ
jgi:uncharacterized secreted protein with C-terminal beta-propeller domain